MIRCFETRSVHRVGQQRSQGSSVHRAGANVFKIIFKSRKLLKRTTNYSIHGTDDVNTVDVNVADVNTADMTLNPRDYKILDEYHRGVYIY